MRGLIAVSLFAVALVMMSTASTVSAHHSFAAFNITTQKTISGTVKQVDWTNPHTWVWIDVPNDKNGVDTWGFEGMSPNYLGRRGWTKSTIKPGGKISNVYRQLRDVSHG